MKRLHAANARHESSMHTMHVGDECTVPMERHVAKQGVDLLVRTLFIRRGVNRVLDDRLGEHGSVT